MKALASDEERIKRFYNENTAGLERRQWFIILVDSVTFATMNRMKYNIAQLFRHIWVNVRVSFLKL